MCMGLLGLVECGAVIFVCCVVVMWCGDVGNNCIYVVFQGLLVLLAICAAVNAQLASM